MGSRKIQIDQMAEAVNEQMEKYSKLSAEVVKAAVTKAGNAVKKDSIPPPVTCWPIFWSTGMRSAAADG